MSKTSSGTELINSVLPTHLHKLFSLAWTVLLYARECPEHNLQSRGKKSNQSDRLHGVAFSHNMVARTRNSGHIFVFLLFSFGFHSLLSQKSYIIPKWDHRLDQLVT